MSEEKLEFDWDHLSDSEWNNKLDELIAQFNEERGVTKLPPPVHTLMDNEYERGINNKLVTEDLIRHYADAVGDPNPIWRNPTYSAGTRWGGIIGPPTFESCVSFGSSFGGLRSAAAMAACWPTPPQMQSEPWPPYRKRCEVEGKASGRFYFPASPVS